MEVMNSLYTKSEDITGRLVCEANADSEGCTIHVVKSGERSCLSVIDLSNVNLQLFHDFQMRIASDPT